MGFLTRASFGQGWVPDADPSRGPTDGLLRMDNCILDELGTVALRQGSAKINSNALADTDVHSLFTVELGGTRYRMYGAGSAIYANGSSVASSVAGSGDIAFGSYLGQILAARSTTKKKYDGTTVRNWGISMTGSAPTVGVLAQDSKVLATCDAGESPGFAANEGTITATYPTGEDGTANGAVEVTPDTGTNRGTITKTFASETDYTSYTGGQTGTDDDLLQLYVWVGEPENLEELIVMVDVNGSSTNPFQDDYYYHRFRLDDETPLDLDTRFNDSNFEAEGYARRRIDAYREQDESRINTFRRDLPSVNAGWNKISVRRGQFRRVGSTAGKGWNTVKALRITFRATDGTVLRFDDIRLVGGADRPLTGTYAYRYVYVYDTGTYEAKSAPSAASAAKAFDAQGGDITVPSDSSRDSQVNEIWLYRMGGTMDAFYRVAVKTNVSGTGAVSISDTTSDRDAMIENVRLETDNTTPPNNIISIAGPYYDRVFALTSDGYLYPSRRLNPDSFSSGQVVRVSGVDETPYWVKKATGGLYIGTSKDVYRLSGTGAELPDGSVDFTLEPLNIDHPPISEAVAQEGNLLVYLADDGWRVMAGTGSQLLTGATSLLYRGYTRHGVSAVNLSSGRFRATLAKGQLVAITPEGSSTTSSTVLYRYDFAKGRWYRHTYGSSWRCVSREPDGTLIASDNAGFVWTLDTGTQDGTSDVSVVLWTRSDDDGQPFAPKEAANLSLHLDTGGDTATVALHLDESSTADDLSISASSDGMGLSIHSLTALDVWRSFQLRLTGSFNVFRFGGYTATYRGLPMGLKAWDSGPMDLGVRDLVWVREIRLKVRAGADLTVTPYFDGVAYTALTVDVSSTDANKTTILSVAMPRGYKGKIPRLVVTSASTFYPYWVEFTRRTTGTDKRTPALRVPAQVGGEAVA